MPCMPPASPSHFYAPRRGLWACTLWLVSLMCACTCLSARAQLPETAHRYELSAQLVPATHTIKGKARITFRNTSDKPLNALLFHLYLNAFRDRKSVFMRESGGQLRGDSAHGVGSITLTTLTVDGQDVLKDAERELIARDATQLRATLLTPLSPGATATIESSFVTHLPPVFARSGYAGDFHMIAQWFPKLAKLEADGTFASFPYHALSEFYADFADYRVTVHTPADFVVGATGTLIEERKVGARVVRVFDAPAVHDAAIVASPRLLTKRSRVHGVDLISLYPAGYEFALKEHEKIVTAGLRHFGQRFGAYPYRTLTMVVPPRGADGAAGMEYPTLFVTAGSWLGLPSVPGLSGIFVTAHELAHQWFQGLLASNEARFPVLDEGLAEWASIDLLRSTLGERDSVASFIPFSRFEVERLAATQLSPPPVPANWSANTYSDNEYGRLIYARSAIALESIRRAHGRARFDRALTLYTKRARFQHPTPSDLAQAFDQVYGRGFSQDTLVPLVFEGASSAVHIASARSFLDGKKYVTEVRARRTGSVDLPTWVAIYGDDGREIKRLRLPIGLAHFDASFRTEQAVARVVLDPDRALLVDANTRDQVRTLRDIAAPRWVTRLTALFQTLLATVGP